ncbi:FMN-dependent NADH-azoreductase [Citromicrobium sp. RCC1885]|uniref:FMN-dependent NADH-azoreductase n=1 Tax=unclassified Citromicrobium TaxID=2630544 RepID=UPI0006C93294|nr:MULTISPECIES: NAD(P)H-dependent oxidoreductase [unclassified Citromicrobium]KPM24799.1 FMN-dependent NADH-azoreductase [Citromicrobium sp. RCC1885]KPM28042.1 FMN-dependent NADH-azoreductase [Citromicrobium sp. RCC1878]OAM10448.1 FMN-dependent NADH-azoreductase [Citromicrobium sp. RCC1897]|tara:strand:+ start:1351 stop:1944 length:594 start_codon:yes stop_codon:yes gene_type:complete
MTNILHVTASIRSEESVSRKLGNKLVEKIGQGTDASIVTRDLAANDLPLIDADRFAANLTPPAERDEKQQALADVADALIAELQATDTLVLSLPVYNFTMPSTLKAWADLVARAGTTFRYTESGPEGLLTGKKAYVVIASGGTPIGSEIDFLTPWLRHFLGFLGITDVEIIAADGIMGIDGEQKIEAAAQTIETLAA